jgi:hypothetical protein
VGVEARYTPRTLPRLNKGKSLFPGIGLSA